MRGRKNKDLNLIVGAGQNDVTFELECRWEDGITMVVQEKVCEVGDWWK